MPRIVEPTEAMIREAAVRLRVGDAVAFPTETVYGLGCDAFNASAIDRIFELKGRPFDNPLIVHLLDPADAAARLAHAWDDRCAALAGRFWPGPLTLVVPKQAQVPSRLTAGRATIAIRAPEHAVARDLLRAFGGPIAAPSANRSGHVSPTTAQHVADEFADVDDLLILDGGPCALGIESTVLDMTANPPCILRPGSVSTQDVAGVIGNVTLREAQAQAASPGTSPRHYAPRTPARLLNAHDLRNEIMTLRGRPCAVLALPALARALRRREGVSILEMPADPAEYARLLYASLRAADGTGTDIILIESPPGEEPWRAVRDRLHRATAPVAP